MERIKVLDERNVDCRCAVLRTQIGGILRRKIEKRNGKKNSIVWAAQLRTAPHMISASVGCTTEHCTTHD
jgi:hypothetical protein